MAFLFLTRGKLPHERIWLKFFRQDELERHAIFVHAPADHQYKESSLWCAACGSHAAEDPMHLWTRTCVYMCVFAW